MTRCTYTIKVHVLCWKTILAPRSHMIGDGRTWSHMVGPHCTRSDMVEHHCTDILLKICRARLNTVLHSRTYDCTRSNTVAQNLFLPHTVIQGRTDDRRRSNTVTQTTAHGRTWLHTVARTTVHDRTRSHTVAQKNPQLPEWPTLHTCTVCQEFHSGQTIQRATYSDKSVTKGLAYNKSRHFLL